jgi:type IV secretion system protein VirD4
MLAVHFFFPQNFAAVSLASAGGILGVIAFFVFMGLWMAGTGGALIVGVISLIAGLFGVFVAVPVMLFRQILEFDNALHIYRYQAEGLAGYIVRVVFWLRNMPPPNIPDDTKGARFASPEEIARLHNPHGMGFGHIDGQLLQLHTEKHVLIMASTRSGKGVTLIVPHLLRYEGSAFVLDPKGENAKATGRQRAALNRQVYYLDPFGISGKPQARFNPLSRFTPENMEAESKALAAALFVLAEGEKRDHWFTAGQQLLATLIMFVYISPDIPKDEKDLPTVRRRLLGKLTPTLETMLDMDEADGLLHDLAFSFLKTPDKEFGSIVSVTQRQTDILDNPAMIACLSASGKSGKEGPEVDFAEWHRGTMTVYLCLSAPKFPVFNRWLRLVLTSALDEMTDNLNPPPLPVCFMLDELATLGHVQPIENAIGLAAGYGVQLVTVFQDVAQMRDLYKGRWASFIGNAGVRALFNLDDYDTAKYWSDFMGGRLYETQSQQQDIHGLSKGQNVGETMRPLLSPEQIMLEYGHDRMLVLPQGARPIVTKRKAYWNDPALDGLWDDPRKPARTMHGGPGTPPPRPAPPTSPTPQPPSGGPSGSPQRQQTPPAPATRPAPMPSPLEADMPVEVDRYIAGDLVYVMFSDGSIEEHSPSGSVQRYPTLQALREAARPQKPKQEDSSAYDYDDWGGELCPCGSGKIYEECCSEWVTQAPPPPKRPGE